MLMPNINLDHKVILITGAAGFIGSKLAMTLLKTVEGVCIIGIDNMNDYYEVSLKEYRLRQINAMLVGVTGSFQFVKGSIADRELINNVFQQRKPSIVVNLAAQAGVRYSITNPDVYIESNLVGFYNMLEACRKYSVKHFLYASSSSVYGNNKKYLIVWKIRQIIQ